ncbi:MAG: zinc ribbon domain-containing protein [Anaerolineaceae bacterium]|jgi:putative FmdB family regulatory protein|nr:zinc ribbon domain-containing protein [Anaerolineaceae bacterium]MDD4043212.1 zinc ribbon domain-containing protein [Anaerolineaceae bacterium]MDD4577544.1 zinc ribbon domain-containing protein [Anaerolineaceae bacterium]
MPVYSYVCEECGHRFDQFQHFTDDALTVCPNCCQVALRKVYTPVGIVFKGKGFYATDNRSPSGQKSVHKDTVDGGNGSKSPTESAKSEGSSKEPSKETTKTAE